MPDWLYSILQIILFIVCLSTLVLIHEAGHLAAAKIFKVYCADFSIGFGKAFLHKKRKKGETYFLKARTIHAIGAGCLVCEIQQSSNVTYRLYDYERTGYKGKPRQLHLDKAFEVLETKKNKTDFKAQYSVLEFPGYRKQLLGQCKYFVATKYIVDGELSLAAAGASFRAVIVIDGAGKIGNGHISYNTGLGDTWFIGSKEIINIKGKLTVIIASI